MTEAAGPFEGINSLQSNIYDKAPESWDKFGASAGELVVSTFGSEFEHELLGGRNEIVAYSSLREAFQSPETTVATLDDPNTGELAGFTLSIPIGKMYPERESESSETSYIYFTVLQEKLRGKKLVGKLTDQAFLDLAKRGYKFVERDSMIEDGYADKVSRHYEGSIVESYDHERFPEVGPERFFRIDINKYLEKQNIGSNAQ